MRQKSALDPIIPGPNLYESVCGDALEVLSSESKPRSSQGVLTSRTPLFEGCCYQVSKFMQFFIFLGFFCDTKKVPGGYPLGIKEKKNYVKHFVKWNVNKHTSIPFSKMPYTRFYTL